MPWTPHSKVDQRCPACVFLVIERLKSSAGRCSYWPSPQRLAWLGTWVSGRLFDFPQVNQSHPDTPHYSILSRCALVASRVT